MINNLYDTHFHLDLQKNLNLALEEINKKEVYTIAVTNIPDLYRKEVAQIESPYVRLALGFHPELILEYKHQIPLMWELLPQVRYVGEVGLDFSSTGYERAQVSFFEELIGRCFNESKKIVSIHSRKSASTVLDIIGDKFSFNPILHWFTGNKKELEIAIEKGYYFSINASMVNSSSGRKIIDRIPKTQLLLETDSPFTMKCPQIRNLKATLDFLDPENTGYLWKNFSKLLHDSSM
jgi:Mg-dependent DNase